MKIKPTDNVEFLGLHATVKAVGDSSGPGEFEAILSTDSVDRDGESISFKAFDPLPASIPLFYQHDWRQGALPVGRGEPFYDGKSLKIRGSFASTERGQEMRSLVTEGVVDAMSVGFLNGKRETVAGQKSVLKGDLFESSFTAIPVNSDARVLTSKAVDVKAGARNSKADMQRIQSMHDNTVDLGASCSTAGKSLKAIVGTVEALQERVRDALEDAYGDYATYLRGVDPTGVCYFDWFAGDGDHYRQSFTDDGNVVTLEGTAEEVDIHEVVVPDADADREAEEPGPTMTSVNTSSTADATGKAAAQAAASPAADAETELQLRVRALKLRNTAA